ncbi:MAG: hypothetical protein QG643_2434 [Pseudomonadota bacterium]|nr:hypothetical protein [Pseudomonadota bacterium]
MEITLDESTSVITPPAFGQAWPAQGGRYVGILPPIASRPAVHLVASDEEVSLAWGPYRNIPGATSRHDGPANSRALIEAGKECAAAHWCAQLRAGELQDFHLPSQAELFMALLYAPQVFSQDDWYWSSTQDSRYGAFAQDFAGGYSYWDIKDVELRVRAFRWIPFAA